jgi:hypothetical protein
MIWIKRRARAIETMKMRCHFPIRLPAAAAKWRRI